MKKIVRLKYYVSRVYYVICYFSRNLITNTTQIPLSKSAEEWAKIILEKTKNFKRHDCSHLIQQAGFDIHDTVRQLQTKYLK